MTGAPPAGGAVTQWEARRCFLITNLRAKVTFYSHMMMHILLGGVGCVRECVCEPSESSSPELGLLDWPLNTKDSYKKKNRIH